MNKIRWGVLSTAKIGILKVIPEMMKSKSCIIHGIASRNGSHAKKVSKELGIPKSYSSYEELLNDPEIEAIYNPLPNHLHVPLTIEAIKKGKHVLCEKPIALNAQETRTLIDVSKKHPHIKVMEAFMYPFHPQWALAKSMLGELGPLKLIETHFSYFNDDPKNIRNNLETGGGALLDIGCYPISLSRALFQEEPKKVYASGKRDLNFGTDILLTGTMEFSKGTSVFTVSTQLAPHQNVKIFGQKSHIEIDLPFNPPLDKDTTIFFKKEMSVKPALQYALQGDAFSQSILKGTQVPLPLEDSLSNMMVIDALFKSFETNKWVDV
ncbi:MAG: Gfo/Idh/MocA family oxidoreductase [Bdellovibrionota bacterium]|nr:Gfo/Idh/MocA family oxidoreductase [Bdellovibrionota bacterium]